MNIKPLGNRVVIQVLKEREETESGIVLPESAKEEPKQGKVVAVGPGKTLDTGEKAPLQVSEGDRVIFSEYAGTEVELKGEEYLILREDDVLAIVE